MHNYCMYHINHTNRDMIGREFAMNAEYNGIAEINNIIILYPQVKADTDRNPRGCWDWYVFSTVEPLHH